jgi:hypothetical protein
MIGTQKAAYRRFRFTAVPLTWGGIAHVDRPAAAFLRSYQRSGATPGPGARAVRAGSRPTRSSR